MSKPLRQDVLSNSLVTFAESLDYIVRLVLLLYSSLFGKKRSQYLIRYADQLSELA